MLFRLKEGFFLLLLPHRLYRKSWRQFLGLIRKINYTDETQFICTEEAEKNGKAGNKQIMELFNQSEQCNAVNSAYI